MAKETKQRKHNRPKLLVVFDTNVLFTDSASDLLRQEAANLITGSKFADLEICWYLPEIVRHERQYQMQKRASALLPYVAKVEKLLGLKLAISEGTLVASVEKVIDQKLEELGLFILQPDYAKVDWNRVALDAVYRVAPFQDGEKEKGFRDRIIVESFLQLVDLSPKTPKICRIVLISNDELTSQAARLRTQGSENTHVLANIEELKGLINTLVSQVDESFLALLKPKAGKIFFVPEDESTMFYREQVANQLEEKFKRELQVVPAGADARRNGTWRISGPQFVSKTGHRICWSSRISIEAEALKTTQTDSGETSSFGKVVQAYTQAYGSDQTFGNLSQLASLLNSQYGENQITAKTTLPLMYAASPSSPNITIASTVGSSLPTLTSTTTHKGVDVYEVLWSTDVTTNRSLRRPTIDEIKHGDLSWEQVA